MLDNFDGVIFDLDGTLIDSMGLWHQIDIEYLGKKGIIVPANLQQMIEGMSFKETAVFFKEYFSLPETVEEIMDVWNIMSFEMYTTQVTLKPGAIELLDFIKNKSLKMAIATSNSAHLANAVLKAINIDKYFDVVVTGCDISKGKPDPEIYLKASEKIKVVPNKCLVFEDIPNGIKAGKNAGMIVCAVEDVYSMKLKNEKTALADYYIKDFNSFIKELCRS